MVGFDPASIGKDTTSDHLIAGVVSGFLTRCALQPIDVLKIRFQV